MSRNKLPPIPPEDMEEWQDFSTSIKPLKQRAQKQKPNLPEIKFPHAYTAAPRLPDMAIRPLPALQPGEKSGIDKRSFDALRKGEMAINAKLDLHGKSFAHAFQIFMDFIHKSAADGKRCVLVITGKGKPQSGPTLHNALPDWINHKEIRPLIITYTPAANKHGGHGAYTILLKRKH